MRDLFRFGFNLAVFSLVIIGCSTNESNTYTGSPINTEIIESNEVIIQAVVPTPNINDINKVLKEDTVDMLPTMVPVISKNVETNIRPLILAGENNALLISNDKGTYVNNEVRYEDQIYITWSILNSGSRDISDMFFVDVYLEDILVERWEIDGLAANQYVSVRDWDGMKDRIRLADGKNKLSLVIDPTGLLNELNELDNQVDIEFVLIGAESESVISEKHITAVLPDIVPWVLPDWEDTLVTTSNSGSTKSGKLSKDVQTHIRFGFSNQSLVSIPGDMWVYIYLDDILVNAQKGKGLLAEEYIGSKEWSEINTVIEIDPGVHKLRVELDATNLILETNETNNTIEKELIWLDGPIHSDANSISTEDQIQLVPEPLTLPNLVPGWRDGWDGPIIVSNAKDTFTDTSLASGSDAFVDLVIHNRSIVGTQNSFNVDLYFDDLFVDRINIGTSVQPNELKWISDLDQLNNFTDIETGSHTLKMIIDPDNLVMESDENDNIYERHFIWSAVEPKKPGIISYTNEEISEKLNRIEELLATRLVAIDSNGTDFSDEILDIVDAGYYLVTGGSFLDERVDILILSRQDFLEWIDDYYSEQFALNEASRYKAISDEKQRVKERGSGLKTNRFGKDVIVVSGDYMVADVIGTVAHELGHLRQGIINPNYSDGRSSYYWKALKEAQAQQFERTFWLYIQDFIGHNIMEYPDYDGFHTLIQKNLVSFLENMSDDEHLFGLLLQWLVVLEDQEMSTLRVELNETGQLSSDASRLLYEHMVSITEEKSEDYVSNKLKKLYSDISTIEELILRRLLKGDFTEGSPDLRFPSLFMP